MLEIDKKGNSHDIYNHLEDMPQPRNESINIEDPGSQRKEHIPYIIHDDYPEITIKALILGSILSVLLGAANIYLGLLVGLTVSASIPASVISMAILYLFPNPNILENNIVQTAASAGESLAAGVIFTLPGLAILQQNNSASSDGWTTFLGVNYAYTTFLAMFGGFLGIAFSIPIRRAIITEIVPPLKFPEGVATAEVLKSGQEHGNKVFSLVTGATIGILVSLGEALKLWSPSTAGGVWLYDNRYPSQFVFNVKAALVGVGYIVGPNIGTVLFIGTILQNILIIPLSALINERPPFIPTCTNSTCTSSKDLVNSEFEQTRFIGVGMMVVGALWSLIIIRQPLYTAVKYGLREFKEGIMKKNFSLIKETKRYERDLPFYIVCGVIVVSLVPLWIIFSSYNSRWGYNIILTLVIAIVAFIFSAVAAYMAGLVGSSNNPVSGVTICSCLILSALILAFFGSEDRRGPPTAIMMSCAVACACAISSDNIQDLKSGHILGATPWKQEFIMFVGVFVASIVIAPILELLNTAYVIGSEELDAPQAKIIASIPIGITTGNLPWVYIGVGVGLAVVIIIIDIVLERYNCAFKLPVLAFAVSMYLPMSVITPIFFGGLIHLFTKTTSNDASSDGILFSAGLVAGDSLFSIILAIPVVATSNSSVMAIVAEGNQVQWPIVFPILVLFGSLSYYASKKSCSHGQQ